jgi:hypothetical protein
VTPDSSAPLEVLIHRSEQRPRDEGFNVDAIRR